MKPRFASTNKLLSEELEQSRERVLAAKRQAVLEIWIGLIAKLLNVDCNNRFKTCILAKGGWYFCTKARCSAQSGHNDFSVRKNASPGYFALINGDGAARRNAFKVSHDFVF